MDKHTDADFKYAADIYKQKKDIRHQLGAWHILKSLLWSLYRFAPWHSYFIIALVFIFISIVGVFLIKLFREITGGLGIALLFIVRALRKIVNPISKAFHIIKRCLRKGRCTSKKPVHSEIHWHMDTFHAMSALKTKRGCKDIQNWWEDIVYWIQRSIGSSGFCRDLAWYKSISLTRYLVYYPLKWTFWISVHGDCHPTIGSDMCAIAGLEYVFEFLLKKGILMLVILTRCWPLIKTLFKVIRLEIVLLVYEIKYHIHRLNPRQIAHKHTKLNYWQRRKYFHNDSKKKLK